MGPPTPGPTGVTYTTPAGGTPIGVNDVWFGERTPDPGGQRAMTVAEAATEFSLLGVNRFRQFPLHDALWHGVQPQAGGFLWQGPDAVIPAFPHMALPTLFDLQFANATPPWRRDTGMSFTATCDGDTDAYVAAVVDRYKEQVTYWEIGNEMDHWRAADPGVNPPGREQRPANRPAEGYSPEEQGRFLACVAATIRKHEPSAKIVMPGMGEISDQVLDAWLTGVISGAGKDTFDVINYHFYEPWDRLPGAHAHLRAKLAELGLADREVWLTETGATSDPTLDKRTNYPNSESEQAADVFRRMTLAYGYGDRTVLWHTLVDSESGDANPWRGYGLLTNTDRRRKMSWYAFQLLAHEVLPFDTATVLEAGLDRYVVHFTRPGGGQRWVAWGRGSLARPAGATRETTVLITGSPPWAPLTGETIPLTEVPVLIATSG